MRDPQTELAKVADMIRDLYTEHPNGTVQEAWDLEHRVRAELADVLKRHPEITSAQVALAAGVRQLMVARLIPDGPARVAALRDARHDADRYRSDVMEQIKVHALADVARGDSEREVAARYGIDRARTLRRWIGAQPVYLYETDATCYIQRGDGPIWGFADSALTLPDSGIFADDAAAWVAGEWAPTVEDGWITFEYSDVMVHVATYTAQRGVEIEPGAD